MICITGMHRSGTSLVTSWLEDCGLKLYDKVGAHIGNTLGHYEDSRILNVHISALKRISSKSKGWIVDFETKTILTEDEKDQLIKIVDERAKLCENWGWKDPRASLFLYEWKELFPEMQTIFLWRNCDLVVESLIRRARKAKHEPAFSINIKQAVINWKIHNTRIYNYHNCNSENSILVNIDNLLKNSCRVIREINTRFDLNLKERDILQFYNKGMINDKIKGLHIKSEFYKYFYNVNSVEQKLVNASFSGKD